MWSGILWGAAIALVNGLGTLLLVRWSLPKGNQIFMMVIMGGMFIRLFVIGGASILVLKFTEAEPVWFLAVLASLFLLFLGLEIIMVIKAGSQQHRDAGD
jgi:hypothetical protein